MNGVSLSAGLGIRFPVRRSRFARIHAFFRKVARRLSVSSFASAGASAGSSASLPDNALALRAAGDPDAFTELFHRFFKPVYRYFLCRLRSPDDAEDLTSETFTKVYRKLHTFREQGTPFTAWLFAIARNVLIDHLRGRKETEPIDEMEDDARVATEMDLGGIDRAILKEQVWEALGKLPAKYRELWALKLTSDLPHREIATLLGTTEGNVNVMVHRSLAKLKEHLLPFFRAGA